MQDITAFDEKDLKHAHAQVGYYSSHKCGFQTCHRATHIDADQEHLPDDSEALL